MRILLECGTTTSFMSSWAERLRDTSASKPTRAKSAREDDAKRWASPKSPVNARAMMLAFLLQPLVALAGTASFDCSKASTRTERTICADTLLSEFDVALASAYRTLISQSFSPLEFRQEQASWLKKRDMCQDADCLRA